MTTQDLLTRAKCLHPSTILNKYTHEYVTVPCGTCDACLVAAANRRSAQLDYVSKSSPMSLFLTLTYDNDHLPIAALSYDANLRDVWTGTYVRKHIRGVPEYATEILDVPYMSNRDWSYVSRGYVDNLNRPISVDNAYTFAYLRKDDVQRFIKRLRFFLTTKYNIDGLFYYVAGEYGPSSLRPHYHAVLCFDSIHDYNKIAHCVHLAWRQGRIDLQIINTNAASYVSDYINGSQNLPKYLLQKWSKPFCTHSKIAPYLMSLGVPQTRRDYFEQASPVYTDGANVYPLVASLRNALFPRPCGLCKVNYQSLSDCYSEFRQKIIRVERRYVNSRGRLDSAFDFVNRDDILRLTRTKVYPCTDSTLTVVPPMYYTNVLFANKIDELSKRFCLSLYNVLHIVADYYNNSDYYNLTNMYSVEETTNNVIDPFDLITCLLYRSDISHYFVEGLPMNSWPIYIIKSFKLQGIYDVIFDNNGNLRYRISDLIATDAYIDFVKESKDKYFGKIKTKAVNDRYKFNF